MTDHIVVTSIGFTAMTLRNFLSSIRGIETPLGGISWEPPAAARKTIHAFLQRIADRRLIYRTHGAFKYGYVIDSLKTMRQNVNEALAELEPDARGREHLLRIRDALHIFQTFVEDQYPELRSITRIDQQAPGSNEVAKAIHELRTKLSQLLTALAGEYGLEIDEDLRWDLRNL